jgi:hypothetical protein
MQILFELCRFRNAHPAFNGQFKLLDTVDDIRESVLYLPTGPSTARGSPSMQAMPGSADSQERTVQDGGGSFRAQTVRSSMESSRSARGDRQFLTDVVGASIDILDSVDALDQGQELDWCGSPKPSPKKFWLWAASCAPKCSSSPVGLCRDGVSEMEARRRAQRHGVSDSTVKTHWCIRQNC